MATALANQPPPAERKPSIWLLYIGFLAAMYSLLFLSMTEHFGPAQLMDRCVLMNPKLARIWSVANVEVGVAYFGVFGAMTYYLIVIRRSQGRHLNDLFLACAYLVASFILNYTCVLTFNSPFIALLVGDAIVMTFTLVVSRELWFQRLLGVFVPLIFLTCGLGHLLEGMSYWRLTYPLNVPWSMVTADIGFAVLVNSARYPAFIRGQDVLQDLERMKAQAAARHSFFRDVLYSVSDGKLHFHLESETMPAQLPIRETVEPLDARSLASAREVVGNLADDLGFAPERRDCLITATGEALMNAIVHGADAKMTVGADGRRIQVWVADKGKGIPLEDLPSATLQKGWSSRGTMGIGFPLMLSTADSVDILTSDSGTTVVLTVDAEEVAGMKSPFSALSDSEAFRR